MPLIRKIRFELQIIFRKNYLYLIGLELLLSFPLLTRINIWKLYGELLKNVA